MTKQKDDELYNLKLERKYCYAAIKMYRDERREAGYRMLHKQIRLAEVRERIKEIEGKTV